MQQPASHPEFIPATSGVPASNAPQIADAVTTPQTAGVISAAGAVPPARASSSAPLLSVLPSGSLTYKMQPTRFEAIAAETLNNAGSSGDGFDSMISPVLADFGADQPALASMDAGLSDAEFADGEFTAAVHAPITADIVDLFASGDAGVGDVATAFGTTPAAVPAPAPPVIDVAPDSGGGDAGKPPPIDNGGGIGWTDWGDPLDNASE